MKRNIVFILLLIALLCPICNSSAQVWVYQYPDTLVNTAVLGKNFRSPVYDVLVKQSGKDYKPYVLADFNTFPPEGEQRKMMTEWNHSANFSFNGKIEIEITKKDGSAIENCKVYPLAKNIQFTALGKKVVITLDKPQLLYVEMEGMEEDPLFIFADPPEKNIPDPAGNDVLVIKPGMTGDEVKRLISTTAKSVIYFEKGIHSFGIQTGKEYPGYQLPIVGDKTYYFPGGAYVIGSFYGVSASNTSFRGRGIISACGKERLASASSIPYNLIMFDGPAINQLIEGLTFTNPNHFCVLSRGEMTCRYSKMFGWWHQTDGWGSGDNSVIEDCFIKVNDDFIKVYNANQRVSNIVFYKQINGAAIQFGWNVNGRAKNCTIKDLYIVKDDPKTPGRTSNTAVISLVNNSGSDISDIIISNIFIENDVQRTVGIQCQGGNLKNFIIKDIFHSGKNNSPNYLYTQKEGKIDNIVFENIRMNNKCITNATDFNLDIGEGVTNIIFNPCK